MQEISFVHPLDLRQGASYYGPKYSFTVTKVVPANGHKIFVFENLRLQGEQTCTGILHPAGMKLNYCKGNLPAEDLLAQLPQSQGGGSQSA